MKKFQGFEYNLSHDIRWTIWTEEFWIKFQNFLKDYNSRYICKVVQYSDTSAFVESCDGEVNSCHIEGNKMIIDNPEHRKILDIEPDFEFKWFDCRYHNRNGVSVVM